MPDVRLAIPAAALWVCCGAGVGAAGAMPGAAVVAGVGAVAALVAGRLSGTGRAGRPSRHARRAVGRRSRRCHPSRGSRRPWPAVAISLAAVVLGAASIAALAPGRTDPTLGTASTHHGTVDVALRVESAPKRAAPGLDGADRWRLRGTTVATATTPRHPAADPIHPGVPVSVLLPGTPHSVRAFTLGTIIAGSMSVRPNDLGRPPPSPSAPPPRRTSASPRRGGSPGRRRSAPPSPPRPPRPPATAAHSCPDSPSATRRTSAPTSTTP